MNAWDVYLDGWYIDTVYFSDKCDSRYVLHALIHHDLYNERIKVVLSNV